MKFLYSVSTLLIFSLTLNSQLFAQFDGENGQMPLSYELEDDSRPNFLNMEAEEMVFERWEQRLLGLGLNNVQTQEEIQLSEILEGLGGESEEIRKENEALQGYITRLEQRNEVIQNQQHAMTEMMLDLVEESNLYQEMKNDIAEEEVELVEENDMESAALEAEIVRFNQELEVNEVRILEQWTQIEVNESRLEEVEDLDRIISFVAANQPNKVIKLAVNP